MMLTVREDDVGRWWSFRRILISLRDGEARFSQIFNKRSDSQDPYVRDDGIVPWDDADISFSPLGL